jgi:hypothetical protein
MTICSSFHARRIYMPMRLDESVHMYMLTARLHDLKVLSFNDLDIYASKLGNACVFV